MRAFLFILLGLSFFSLKSTAEPNICDNTFATILKIHRFVRMPPTFSTWKPADLKANFIQAREALELATKKAPSDDPYKDELVQCHKNSDAAGRKSVGSNGCVEERQAKHQARLAFLRADQAKYNLASAPVTQSKLSGMASEDLEFKFDVAENRGQSEAVMLRIYKKDGIPLAAEVHEKTKFKTYHLDADCRVSKVGLGYLDDPSRATQLWREVTAKDCAAKAWEKGDSAEQAVEEACVVSGAVFGPGRTKTSSVVPPADAVK